MNTVDDGNLSMKSGFLSTLKSGKNQSQYHNLTYKYSEAWFKQGEEHEDNEFIGSIPKQSYGICSFQS